jgi:hypothetical protein
MAKRVIRELRWARMCSRPPGIPVGRARGAKGRGVTYERDLARFLPLAAHGQWFEFEDAEGLGYCQTDLILSLEDVVAVFEAKYTWTIDGLRELRDLYLPVVGEALIKPVSGVMVCRVLTSEVRGLVPLASDLDHALHHASCYQLSTWHWLGSGKRLVPHPRVPKVLAVDEVLSRRVA